MPDVDVVADVVVDVVVVVDVDVDVDVHVDVDVDVDANVNVDGSGPPNLVHLPGFKTRRTPPPSSTATFL